MTEVYLSRLWLNPRNHRVRREINDCHELHRTILSAFPNLEDKLKNARTEFGVLFRIEFNERQGKVCLLVQSKVKPNWNSLPEKYLMEDTEESVSCKEISSSYTALPNGMPLMFRLKANPTKCVSAKNITEVSAKFVGKRVELRKPDEQTDWLRNKSERHGFKLVSVKLTPEIADVSASPKSKITGIRANRKLTFGAVLFEGHLMITDAEKFRETLAEGIGQGKAYGFGLLSIARV